MTLGRAPWQRCFLAPRILTGASSKGRDSVQKRFHRRTPRTRSDAAVTVVGAIPCQSVEVARNDLPCQLADGDER